MNILFRYLFKTAARFQLGMFAGFSLLLVGQQVIGLLENLPNIKINQLALIVLYILPDAINDIAPIALILAVLLTGNQLYSQSEIYILRTTGLNPFRISLPMLTLGLLTGIIMTINASYLKPFSALKLSELVFNVTNANFTEYLIPGEFRTLDKLGLTLTAERNDNGILKNVFLRNNENGQTITGESAKIINNSLYNYSLVIQNGSSIQVTPTNVMLTDFSSYNIKLINQVFTPRDNIEFYDSAKLAHKDGNYPKTELQWRLSRFMFCLCLCAIALLFIPKNPRAGTSLSIFSGIVMFFLYNQVANSAYRLGTKGILDAGYLFWWLYPSLYVGVLILFLITRWIIRAR